MVFSFIVGAAIRLKRVTRVRAQNRARDLLCCFRRKL